MDLCSKTGVIVDQRTLDPLVWTAFDEHNRLVFGSVVVTIEVNRSNTSSGQQNLFLDEDSTDFIDCSIDESSIATTRKAATTTLQNVSQRPFAAIHSSAPVHTVVQSSRDAKDRRSSVFVAATQQLDTSACSTVANETLTRSKEGSVAKPPEGNETNQVQLDDDGSFDGFYIPETQLPEDEVEHPPPQNVPSDSAVAVKASGNAISLSNRTKDEEEEEEEYIQLTALNEDNNSDDGLFNNMYVAASQNLLDAEMDTIYQREAAKDVACKRVGSILPDRSVDSISFIEHRHNNTTEDMSRIEWNESRVTENPDQSSLKSTAAKPLPAVQLGVLANSGQDDRSVTPELNFDKPSEGKDPGRSGSTTPDLQFTSIPQPVDAGVDIATKESEKNSRETPIIDFDEVDQEALEIPRNQEQPLPQQSKSPDLIGAYELETQALEVDDAVLPSDEDATVRQSQIFVQPNDREQQKSLEISPSSNKENQTGDDRTSSRSEGDDTDVDDIYLASTIPIGELISSKSDSKGKKVNQKPVGKGKQAESLFQLPSKVENTPKAPKRKPSVLDEFLTPEHPLFALPKPDNILSTTNVIAEKAMRNRLPSKAKLQYPFGDGSSSEDESNDKGIFKKTNRSKEFERELEKAKEESLRIKQIQKEAGAKSGSIKPSRSNRIDDKKPVMESSAAGDRGSKSSSRSKSTKEKKTTGRKERSVSKEKETKPTRTRLKTTSVARPVYKEESSSDDDFGDDKRNVPVRSGRGMDREKPEVVVDKSIEYVGSNATTESLPKTRGRKRKDVSTDKEKDVQSEEGLAKAPTRVSKRQKASNPRYKDDSEPTWPSRVRSKVDSSVQNGKSSANLFGDMLSGYNSSNSGSASDGSKRSTRAAGNRTMIMFTRINDKLYKDSILRAGCKIVDIPEMATILVTDRVARTCKFLCAVARGIPIVGQSYLDALKTVGNGSDVVAAVDPWQHILLDRESEKRYKFDLRKTLLKAQNAKLLSVMLSSAGAIALKNPGSSRAPKDCHKTFVISCPADATSWEKYREKYPTIEIVSTEWLMCSLMQYSISFKNHRLV
uniref:PAX-interacting protein 1 n=1 Tax=Anopheles albimanus TaxID=7167 RepID=A0A182FFP4_ANOAL